jgi:hypothetical protein
MPFTSPKITLELKRSTIDRYYQWLDRNLLSVLVLFLSAMSIWYFMYFYQNKLGLAYNDARSHLDIGRRVVEGLKPGLAQLGSVWLPLPHILMAPTIWNDFMWHTGLSGALESMISFVVTSMLIYKILCKLGVGIFGRIFGVIVFATNLNIIYLQSTAMTELLLIATMTAGIFELINYHRDDDILSLIKSSFWIMLSTLVRYDGWFLFLYGAALVVIHALRKRKFRMSEGMFFLFCTLGGFGIFMWFVWNQLIFHDPLYFVFGPYSAHAQQDQLASAGVLLTKGNLWLSIKTYWYAMVFNTGMVPLILGAIGAVVLWSNRKIPASVRIATTALLAPLFFNVIALYLGHSVLFVQNINGNTWFNVRYGIMMMPSFAVFAGYLVQKWKPMRWLIAGVFVFAIVFQFASRDAVTIDDGRVGSSQKNVTEVSGWLRDNAADKKGFVLISAASHDAIIFSSGLPMKKFIHEGTGNYWLSATENPDRWARWIIMRTNDTSDQTFKLVQKSGALPKYNLVQTYPFADIYELKPEYLSQLTTDPVFGRQK